MVKKATRKLRFIISEMNIAVNMLYNEPKSIGSNLARYKLGQQVLKAIKMHVFFLFWDFLN